MQRASESIGTIAAALAKAQAQLINPEKSLVGTIRSDQASPVQWIRAVLPLRATIERARYRPQDLKPA
jgi:hypothetical protein